MKITTDRLRQIIKEELDAVLSERTYQPVRKALRPSDPRFALPDPGDVEYYDETEKDDYDDYDDYDYDDTVLREEENFSNMEEKELIEYIVEKIPSLRLMLSQTGYYDKKILEKLANDVSLPSKLGARLQEIRDLQKVLKEIELEGFTYDKEKENILNTHYKEWDEYDFDKYIRLLRVALREE